jgi:hypothetical protein
VRSPAGEGAIVPSWGGAEFCPQVGQIPAKANTKAAKQVVFQFMPSSNFQSQFVERNKFRSTKGISVSARHEDLSFHRKLIAPNLTTISKEGVLPKKPVKMP